MVSASNSEAILSFGKLYAPFHKLDSSGLGYVPLPQHVEEMGLRDGVIYKTVDIDLHLILLGEVCLFRLGYEAESSS